MQEGLSDFSSQSRFGIYPKRHMQLPDMSHFRSLGQSHLPKIKKFQFEILPCPMPDVSLKLVEYRGHLFVMNIRNEQLCSY